MQIKYVKIPQRLRQRRFFQFLWWKGVHVKWRTEDNKIKESEIVKIGKSSTGSDGFGVWWGVGCGRHPLPDGKAASKLEANPDAKRTMNFLFLIWSD